MQVEALLALSFVSRLMLGVVFLYSAWGKFADVTGFARGLSAYQLLPVWAILPLTWLLPFLELFLALAFLVGWALPIVSLVAILLLIIFIAAIAINLRRGRTISCNCHGSAAQTPISWGLVARNGLLLILALLLVVTAPLNLLPMPLAVYWRVELALLVSWAALPIVMLIACFFVCSILLTTMIDVRSVVRKVT